jgi:hypothetical protein
VIKDDQKRWSDQSAFLTTDVSDVSVLSLLGVFFIRSTAGTLQAAALLATELWLEGRRGS